MRLRNVLVAGVMAACSIAGFAQTVTGSGSPNSVPKFTGSSNPGSAITNSAITEVNGNVGIGTTPVNPLSVYTPGGASPIGAMSIDVGTFSTLANASNSYFFRVRDLGSGGIPFYIQGTGNVGIGTTGPTGKLGIAGNGTLLSLNYANDGGSNFIQWVNTSGVELWRLGGGMQIQENELSFDEGTTSRLYLRSGGNVGIGTTSPAAKLDVNGSVKISGSGASMSFPDDTVQSTAWNGTTCGGDYAESIDVTGDRKSYEPGDVLVVDPKVEGKFLKSSEPYATTVMGIYSTQPGLTGRRVGAPKTGEEVPMAMLGIVPTKVSAENGSIKPGDLLVTSSIPGYAMKATDRSRMVGALIGKALGHLDSGTGVIEVGIALQ